MSNKENIVVRITSREDAKNLPLCELEERYKPLEEDITLGIAKGKIVLLESKDKYVAIDVVESTDESIFSSSMKEAIRILNNG